MIWVASLLLETQSRADQTIPVADFLESWRNHLLEEWRDISNLELIQVRVKFLVVCYFVLIAVKDLCTQPSQSRIGLKPELRLSGPPQVTEKEITEIVPTKARKWHEKFKKGRT